MDVITAFYRLNVVKKSVLNQRKAKHATFADGDFVIAYDCQAPYGAVRIDGHLGFWSNGKDSQAMEIVGMHRARSAYTDFARAMDSYFLVYVEWKLDLNSPANYPIA